eukprot:169919_1
MRSFLFLLISPFVIAPSPDPICVYTDTSSGQRLYLDALAHSKLTYIPDEPHDQHTYTFTPCRNAAGHCTDSTGAVNTAMCRQTLASDDGICTVVAQFDRDVQPTFDPSGGGQWQFVYQNGDSTGCPDGLPRTFTVNLNCSISSGDFKIISGGEKGEGCNYEFNLATRWACKGQVYATTDDGLSGGSIFLILLGSAVFSYFCIGWCLCAYMNKDDRQWTDISNIPNVTFWAKCPALVYAGCCFTKDFCCGLCAKDNTGNEDIGYEQQIDK